VSGVVSAGAATSVGAGAGTGAGGVGVVVVVVVVVVGSGGVGAFATGLGFGPGLGAFGLGERRGDVSGAELVGVGSETVDGEGEGELEDVDGGDAARITREASCGEGWTDVGALRATIVGRRRGAGALWRTSGFTFGFGFGRAAARLPFADETGAGSVGSEAPAPAATVVWRPSLLGWAAR